MRLLSFMTSISAMLAACASPIDKPNGPPSIASTACKAKGNKADCYILVDAWKTNGDCKVMVVPSQATVGFDKDAKDKWVEWKLTENAADEGFRFTNKGIEPKTTPDGNVALWNSNFRNGGADHGGKQFKWKNQNDPAVTNAVDYRYFVEVELRESGVTRTCREDPVIRNER